MTNRFFAGQTNYIEEMNALDGETGDHIADATGAHAATAISNTPAGNIAATTVQAAINELDTEKLSASATTLPASFTASSLTSVGTLTALTVSGQASFAAGSAAAPSVKVGAEQNGLYSSAANTLDVALNGVRQFQFGYTAAAVNYFLPFGAGTGVGPVLTVAGSDSTINSMYRTKGTGAHVFETGSSGNTGFYVPHVANSVNCLAAFGGATGVAPTLYADGANTNVNLNYSLKGAGQHVFYTGSTSAIQFVVNHTASAVNSLYVQGSATGNYVGFGATGTDANIGITYTAKGIGTHDYYARNGINFRIGANADSAVNYFTATGGVTGLGPVLLAGGSDTNVTARYRTHGTGAHQFETGSSGNIGLLISHVASAVNYGQFAGNSAGGYPSLRSAGSDTNVGFDFATQGAAPFRFYTNAFGAEQFRVAHTANAVNYAQITGSATGLSVVYGAAGIDANVSTVVTCKGAANVGFYTNNGGSPALFITHTASAVNYWNITGAATGGLNTLTTQGSDTNIGAYLATKGSGAWRFATGGGDQFRIQNVASAVNYLSVYGSPAAGTGPTLYADGSDTNINLLYSLKGGGAHLFYTGGTSAIQLLVGHVASTVNWLAVTGAATGNAVTISAQGSDTNIDFALTTKGTGVLRFGTHSALAAETVTGYITIKDSAGNTRKLAVLS